MKLKMDDFADGDWVPKTIRLCHPPPSRTAYALPHFVLYATNLERCPVGSFTDTAVKAAIRSRRLATFEVTGRYSLYPTLARKLPARYPPLPLLFVSTEVGA